MMKIFLSVILLFPLNANAQKIYDTFVVEGKTWNIMITDASHMFDREGIYFLKGDTVIAGHKCLKMFSTDSYSDDGPTYECALYEDGNKVYGIHKGKETPGLWYDFGAKAGDVLYIDNEAYSTVEKVDTIWFDQVGFKRFFVKFNGGDICWLSGIGNVRDPMKIQPMQGRINEVLSCEVDGLPILKDVVYYINEYGSLLSGDFQWTMRYDIVSPAGGVNYEEIKLHDGKLLNQNEYSFPWREDGGKVYLTGKGLIMDFSAQIGDVVKINEFDDGGTLGISYKVEAISDTVFASSTDKKRRRCLHVRNVYYPSGTDIWVEGIGSLKYGIGGDRTYYGGAWSQLMECRRGDEILYRHEDYVTSVNSIKTSHNHASGIYNLQGRRQMQKPAKGMYIQDGRKRIVK